MIFKYIQLPSLLFCILATNVDIVQASAFTSANAQVSLTVTSINNLNNAGDNTNISIIGRTEASDNNALAQGNADFSATEFNGTAPTALSVGEGVAFNSGVTSESSSQGFAASFHNAEGFIQLENTSLTDIFEIEFLLDFNLDAFAEATDILLDTAAISISELFLFDDESLIFDTFVFADAFDNAELIFSAADIDIDNVSNSFAFSLLLNPLSSNELELFVDLSAISISVPEPSLFLLFISGLILLTRQQKYSLKTSTL